MSEVPTISVEGLKEKLRDAQVPARPRFSDEEVGQIEGVLDAADPRLVTMISIQGAQRAGQLLQAMRSGLTVERDPSGAVTDVALEVPGMGRKQAGKYFLTPAGAFHLIRVLQSGYLRELEAEYQATGTDYPIFPGGVRRLRADAAIPAGQRRNLNRRTMQDWFVELEARAGVRHLDQRAFHGFRRRAVDILVKSGATPAQIQAAGNWSSIQIPMDLYREGVTDQDRREAAAMLGKATSGEKPGNPAADRPSVEVLPRN